MAKGYKWNSLSKEMQGAINEALSDGAEFLLGEANKHVPHDEGTLERSGKTSKPANGEVYISYDTPYARRLHEHPEYKFQGKGRGKWLERAMKENNDEVQKYMADKIRGTLGG